MAVTNKQHFNENNVNRIAVPQNKLSLKKYLAFYYPQWEICLLYTSKPMQPVSSTMRLSMTFLPLMLI